MGKSSWPKAPLNWPLCPPEVEVVLLLVELVLLLPAVEPKLLPKRRKRKNLKKNLMTIWDSDSLTRKCRRNLRISSKKIVIITYILSVFILIQIGTTFDEKCNLQ